MSRSEPPTESPNDVPLVPTQLLERVRDRIGSQADSTPPSLLAALAVSSVIVWSGATSGAAGSPVGSAGSIAVLGAVIVVAAVVFLPMPFGIAMAVLTSAALLDSLPLVLRGGVVVVLVAAAVIGIVDTRLLRSLALLLLMVLLGGGAVTYRPLVTGDGFWWTATVLIVGTATLMYALHRYALVRTGEVTDGD